jgi:hypothetical protein
MRDNDNMYSCAELGSVDFGDLETRYGRESACAILKVLEQFEGVHEAQVAKMSYDERLDQVFYLMQDNLKYQTRH